MGATDKLKEQTGLAKKPTTIQQLLEAMKPQIAMALPKHLSPERMVRIALTSLRTNPDLAECNPQSVMAAIMLASQLGLEPGVLGQCFLIPYKKNCTLVPGWLGILDMVNRAGKATAWTGAVYAGDEFEWALGDKPYVTHRPCGNEQVLTHAYAIARVKGSEFPVIEVWSREKIITHRDKYNKVGSGHYSHKHFEMYGRKVALLQVLKYIPRSIELATAFQLDASAEMGTQHLEIKDVPSIIEGTVTPEEQAVENQTKPEPTICWSCGKNPCEPTCKYATPANAAATVPQDKQSASESTGKPVHNWKLCYAKAKEKGVPQADVKLWYTEAFGVESGNDLTAEQFQGVLDWLESVSNG